MGTNRRLLMLGAAPMQVPAIRYAKGRGLHVITCDYRPDNPGHQWADESHNVSTTDADAVLALARERRVDGVVAYASDPAAPTAAFVAGRLGLPTNPYGAVLTLARKDRFRAHLHAHGFRCPAFAAVGDAAEAAAALPRLGLPVVVKPIDSSGSKGVTVVRDPSGVGAAARSRSARRSRRRTRSRYRTGSTPRCSGS
jgi:biotin carboxylase